MKLIGLIFIFVFVAISDAQTAKDAEMRRLAKLMTGDFDTFAQVDRDEEQNTPYRHIRALLHVRPITVKGMETDGMAFYVENQAAEARTKPYRQRVYLLKRGDDGKLRLLIYKISNDAEFINAHKTPDALAKITSDRLNYEQGCDVIFEPVKDGVYRGVAGEGRTCKSALRGATWATSRTELSAENWTNLDQGFDDTGAHKWGPPPGTIGHIFVKRKTEN